ncbi:hypothetical protein ACSBM8_00770 [Sphingomonas sp. ASY06-1R]|uniref:hypothetical protein n=1 Tax=Sphingomonas sp. ASY06-1R TaxID=3445771 RepID=UPI003FA32C61
MTASAERPKKPPSRSWIELKIVFFIALPLFCALRAADRMLVLISAPIDVQRHIYGRIIAFPWQLKLANIQYGDAFFTDWTYAIDDLPQPLPRCVASQPDPRWPNSPPSCGFAEGGQFWWATWSKGQVQIGSEMILPLEEEDGHGPG